MSEEEAETRVFKNIKPNGELIEYISECNTKIDPFVTCAIRWDEVAKFTDKTVEVEGHMYHGCFIADKIKIVK